MTSSDKHFSDKTSHLNTQTSCSWMLSTFCCCFPCFSKDQEQYPPLLDSKLSEERSLTFLEEASSTPLFSQMSNRSAVFCEVRGWFSGRFAISSSDKGPRVVSVKETKFSKLMNEERRSQFKSVEKIFFEQKSDSIFIKVVKDGNEFNLLQKEFTVAKELSQDPVAKNYFIFLQPVNWPQTVTGAAGWGRLCSYGDLYDFINHYPRQAQQCRDQISSQLYNAIRYLHARKIYHRDIKLDNIVIDNDRTVKLIDFGMSEGGKHGNMTDIPAGTIGYLDPCSTVVRDGKAYFNMKRSDLTASLLVSLKLLYGTVPFKVFDQWQAGCGQGVIKQPFCLSSKCRPDVFLDAFSGELRRVFAQWFHCLPKNEDNLYKTLMFSPVVQKQENQPQSRLANR